MFKEFCLGCLVVGSSLISKKEKLAEMVTRCHSVSLVVTRCTTRCTIRCHSLSLLIPRVVTRCTTRQSFYGLWTQELDAGPWTLDAEDAGS